MPLTLDWTEIALRLLLTVVAGSIIGFNRGEHGRPAGLRTTLLVCLTASLAMIQANLLLCSFGKTTDTFLRVDVMRLPLGILSGMGFIGGGTILRKQSLVLGVTTAATLWFVTVMGLLFGGGQLVLGGVALVLGMTILGALKRVEARMRQDVRATLRATIVGAAPDDGEIRATIARSGCAVMSWGVACSRPDERREVCCEVQWRALPDDTSPPTFVSKLSQTAGVESVRWEPHGISFQQAAPT